MFERATVVSEILLGVVAVVVAAFAAIFGLLIYSAIGATQNAGFTSMFTSYGYVSIEFTFFCLALIGAYQVFRIGLTKRRREDDWDVLDASG